MVTRALAQLAARFSGQLFGQTGAEHHAEQLLAGCLDEIDALDKADE